MRLFVALDLPEAVRDALARFEVDETVWRPVRREQLHITLAFLGTRPDDDVELIRPLLSRTPAPRLALGRARLFGRVLAVEVEDLDGTLGELQAHLSAALAAAGVYPPEARPFRPHVTIARVRPRVKSHRSSRSPEPLTFSCEALTLYVSRLHPSGATYEPLARIAL